MFGMGGVEMLVIGIVALIVVGPKDLPMLFRNVGQFVGKARGMAREFQFAMNKAVDESGMNDISKSLKTATNPIGSALDSVKDAAADATKDLNIDPDSETGKLAAKRAEQTKKIPKHLLHVLPRHAKQTRPQPPWPRLMRLRPR